jgi:hypothetical protein
LTARAYRPELEAMSRRIVAVLAEPEAAADRGRARDRRRLARLGRRIDGAAHPPTRWRRFALAGAIVAGASAVAIAAIGAARYHATYVERTQAATENPHGK